MVAGIVDVARFGAFYAPREKISFPPPPFYIGPYSYTAVINGLCKAVFVNVFLKFSPKEKKTCRKLWTFVMRY